MEHEWGHSQQSKYLGPLYLLIIGIPSFLWAAITIFSYRVLGRKLKYYKFYTERWADKIAGIPNRYKEIN
jgi:hypothetical protein